jgi:hypothetical protein
MREAGKEAERVCCCATSLEDLIVDVARGNAVQVPPVDCFESDLRLFLLSNNRAIYHDQPTTIHRPAVTQL